MHRLCTKCKRSLIVACSIWIVAINDERSGSREPRQRAAPVSPCFGEVLVSKPCNIVSIGTYGRQGRGLALGECHIRSEKLFQQKRERPTIQQQMMMRPDKLICCVP